MLVAWKAVMRDFRLVARLVEKWVVEMAEMLELLSVVQKAVWMVERVCCWAALLAGLKVD